MIVLAGVLMFLVVAQVSPVAAQVPTIRYVQSSYAVPQSPQTSVTVGFPAAQTAGNLNVVVVGWNDASAAVSSVVDSAANPYALAVGPTVRPGKATQAIYYAKNIRSGANTVTVRFTKPAIYPDIRILEYSGLDPANPLHAAAASTGSSASSSSGALTTTTPNVLLVAANVVATGTTGPGAGYTSRMITTPDGDIVEDRIVTAAGSYSAAAPLSSSGFWVMQLVAFKAAAGGAPPDTTPPTATITTPTTAATYTTSTSPLTLGGTAADNVGVTQVSWASDRGGSGVATGTTTWSAGGIALLAGTNVLTVTARDAAGNSGVATLSVTYNAPDSTPPTVTISTPTTGPTYATSTSPLTLGGTAADNVGVTQVSWASDRGGSGVATGTTTWSAGGIALQAGTNVLTVTARDAAGNIRTATLSVTYTALDSTPPTVSITAPNSGASVSGVVTVTATASDNVGVAGVQFLLDGVALGAEQSGPPFSLPWNTTTASNGAHTVSARARDAAGNVSTSVAVPVTVTNAAATIRFVQGAYAVPQSPQTTVTVAFPAAQSAGNLNVVVVGWNDASATVSSVIDSAANPYAVAVGPTVRAGQASQAIYFAKNIRSGANTVTVRFSTAAVYPDIRILEYGGLDAINPLHGAVAATGSSVTASTGSLTTSAANVLLVAANLVATGTAGPGTGFTSRMITVPDGDIVEDRIVTAAGTYSATAPLTGSGFWIMQLVAFSATPPPPDNSPPSVAITAPASGSTVSGTTTISAAASDDVGIAGVAFFVDGQPVGAEVTSTPYAVAWDTTTVSGGGHTLTAIARDPAGNSTTSAPVPVTVAAATPALVGQWAAPMAWPIVAVHASLLPTGEVLISDGQWLGNDARLWNPATNTFTLVRNNNTNIFCSGHCHLADGRVLFAGGHEGGHTGVTDTNLFDPATRAWSLVGPMRTARWYPTVTTLPDGRVLVTAGEMGCAGCDAPLPEVYNPQTNTWTELSAASLALPYYPHMHVLPDGRVLASSTSEHPIVSSILDVAAQTWTPVDPDPVDGGSAVMYLPGKILKAGTSYHPDDPVVPSAATTYVIDTTQPAPRWRQLAPMAYARTYHVLTVLPDGTVLVTGGGATTDAVGVSGGALPAEIWSPATETWTTVASMAAPRLYHSTALLMPDARVLVMGGGRFNGVDEPTDQLSGQLYSPPYLFKGARPTITAAPGSATYGATMAVGTPDAGRIASVALIRLGSVTHAINMDQRFLSLGFTAGSGSLSVQAPANANLAPPGHYMLFLVDTNGVPSVAATIRIQ